MGPILIVAAIVVLAGIAYIAHRRGESKDAPYIPPQAKTPPAKTSPAPAAPAPTAPAKPAADGALGPDAQGRIRIPEVEALGGDWARTWWLAPWVLAEGRDLDLIAEWQIRSNCGCDGTGKLGGAAFRGFDTSTGLDNSPYSWLVPRKFRAGTDRHGRKTVFPASENDIHNADGSWTQLKQLAEPVRITDKLTRSTRAKNGAELAAWLKANGVTGPIPEQPATDPGDWIGH